MRLGSIKGSTISCSRFILQLQRLNRRPDRVGVIFPDRLVRLIAIRILHLQTLADLTIEHQSIAHRKALADMLGLLRFIDHRHRIILDRDAALPICIAQHLIRTQPELARALARSEVG